MRKESPLRLAAAAAVALAVLCVCEAQTTLTLQAGQSPINAAGVATYYNATYDTSITEQYKDPWNFWNGVTYFWGSSETFTLTELGPIEKGNNTRFRTLLRFSNLNAYVPAGTQINSANLTVSFVNWGGNALVQACFMTRAWQHLQVNGYRGTGFNFSSWDSAQAASMPWTVANGELGGWADCSPNSNFSFIVPGGNGMVTRSIQLNTGLVQAWLANGGANNWGLLLRSPNASSLSFVTSQYKSNTSRRPALVLTYGATSSPPPPRPPPPSSPPPPAAVNFPPMVEATVTLQAGRTYPNVYGAQTYYNSTYETSITEQYKDAWNYWNGNTYFWGSAETFGLTEQGPVEQGAPTRFRTLMCFAGLSSFLPANAQVLSAELTLAFVNWGGDAQVQACFMTRAWQHLQVNGNRGTGFNFSSWDTAQAASVPWTMANGELGGWADCSPSANIAFIVPANSMYGTVTKTIQLDAGLVQAWLANGGANNWGLLLRSPNGSSLSIVTSQYKADPTRRPMLSITYATDGSQPPAGSYPVQLGAVARTWWVDPAGDDEANTGHFSMPYKTPYKALFEAFPGDKVYLRSGVYPGAFSITRPGITLQSAPGHWAVIASPLNDPIGAVNVITVRPGADNGVIRNLEIFGGHYYGIMFFTSWENYGSMEDRVACGAGPRNWLLENLRIHDTGGSGIKLVMKSTNVTFRNLEVYNTGARLRTAGHGIEAVQAYGITVQDCYIHDVPAAAVHLAGGTKDALLQRNYVTRTGFGFNLGFATDYEYMDAINNAPLHECISCTAVNNIVNSVAQAGINVWAGRNIAIAHNTLWQAQQYAQNGILVNAYTHDYTPAGSVLTRSANITVRANVIVRSDSARAGPVFAIRTNGLDPATPLVMAHNVYYDAKGLGMVPFQWGKGAMLEDERTGSMFVGNYSGWAAHCASALGQPLCDINSVEADPRLDAAFAPQACSPAVGRAAANLNGAPGVADDFHGCARPAGQRASGAVEPGAAGATKPFPPVPAAFASIPAWFGIGQPPAFDKQWPFDYWRRRACKDIYVDAVSGIDAQQFNWESNYAGPFKTLQAALSHANSCDRVLLKGGQSHPGPAGVFKPNITVMTNPADATRAQLVCANTGASNCFRMGDGDNGGSAAILLQNFDIVMQGNAQGDCIRLNEGGGSGTSAYWSFFLAKHGLQATGRKLTSIKDMTLTDCGMHGIKLSTFVHDVAITGVSIVDPAGTGVEVRGAWNLQLAGNTIVRPGQTGIRLAGGARSALVERNFISNYTDRGILLGSDNTEVMYMDVDWARAPGGSWHDAINVVVRNNIIAGGVGAGIAFYGARDSVVVHNTLVGVSQQLQAGVLLNLSPKKLGNYEEVAPSNANITFRNNVVQLGGDTLMLEARIMQATTSNPVLPANLPAATCPARRLLHSLRGSGSISKAAAASDVLPLSGQHGRRLQQVPLSFASDFVNQPGEQGRNPDGSCPMFPDDHEWHRDVSALPVHPNSESIKSRIGTGNMRPDFGGGTSINGQFVLYGIPFITVDSIKSGGPGMVQFNIGPNGYPDESDLQPNAFPIPANAPVEGAYLNCPEPPCGGDRHVLVIDNATCMLYEAWRSFPPAVTGAANGAWQADAVAKFNLSRNALGRPLGWTSSDAAGLAIVPGLVKFDEVINKGVIDHAIRFTGPNSRPAYAPPATHYAAAGWQHPDNPWMGLRIRVKPTYNCSQHLRVARIFCVALQTYGGIFADNGGRWFFSGEATHNWDSYLSEIYDINNIPSSEVEVLDTGCLCITPECTMADCGAGVPTSGSLPSYAAMADTSTLSFGNNIYHKPSGSPARYVDRKVGSLGQGYDGDLAGWKAHINGDVGSFEADPALKADQGYKPSAGSPARQAVPVLASALQDFNAAARGAVGSPTDAGAVLYT